MCKIEDPRNDSSGIAMRSLRSNYVFKGLKKTICKSQDKKIYFNENKLNLQKIDIIFYNNFISCHESIKQELIFLWEELGLLNEELDKYENLNEENNKVEKNNKVEENNKIDKNEIVLELPPKKRTSIMGP